MALSHAILATLLSGPISGYGLAKRFNRSIGYFWQATHQQIYRELASLEEQGYVLRVSSEYEPSQAQSTEKLNELTAGGRYHLTQWIAQPTEPGILREDLLVKVRAGVLVSPKAMINELRRQRTIHTEKLTIYRSLRERDFADLEQLSYEQRLLYLPLLRGLMFEEENVAWCDAAIAMLQTADRTNGLAEY